MTGERDLTRLLTSMEPVLRPEAYVFTTVDSLPPGLDPVVTVREDEGLTLVLEQGEADRLGLTYAYVAALVSLRVHSSLDAVGLTAAVATELTRHGIGCNVVAGFFHDHLFVPRERGAEVVEVLSALAQSRRRPGS